MSMTKWEFWLSNDELGMAEIHQKCFDVVDDNWRKHLYELNTSEEIATHIIYNMVNNRLTLSRMDGWADLPDDYARITSWPDTTLYVEVVKEL